MLDMNENTDILRLEAESLRLEAESLRNIQHFDCVDIKLQSLSDYWWCCLC
jgi:hypothetical protein